MHLLLDIGNTSIHWAILLDEGLAATLPINDCAFYKTGRLLHTEIHQLTKIAEACSAVCIASVVPLLSEKIVQLFNNKICKILTYQDFADIRIAVDEPAQVGIDRLVNVLAGSRLYPGQNLILIDFGTATTFDVFSGDRTYHGGVIAPGIALSRDVLNDKTALLPHIEIQMPAHVVGKNTTTAMQSGLVIAYQEMLKGMINRINIEMEWNCESTIIGATGGYADLVCQDIEAITFIEKNLTLVGLALTKGLLSPRINTD